MYYMLAKLLQTKQDDSQLNGFKRLNVVDVFVVVEESGYDIFGGVKTGNLFNRGEYNYVRIRTSSSALGYLTITNLDYLLC